MRWALAASKPRYHQILGDRHAGGAKQRLGIVLLHGDGGGHDAGMAVRNAEDLQETLQRAVLAGPAVQHIERGVRLGSGERRCDVAA